MSYEKNQFFNLKYQIEYWKWVNSLILFVLLIDIFSNQLNNYIELVIIPNKNKHFQYFDLLYVILKDNYQYRRRNS